LRVKYVRLPPARESLPHSKVIAVLIAVAFASCVVEAARHYQRPLPESNAGHER
jgi:hypothetical protein